MSTKEKIRDLFNKHKELTVTEIANELFVSKQSVHKSLNQLVEENVIEKIGRTPKTIYRKISKPIIDKKPLQEISVKDGQYLEENFLLITEIGEMLNGAAGFELWCRKRNLPFKKTVAEFIQTNTKYHLYRDNNGLISGLEKIKNTKGYEKIYLDEILYLDFYAIERFGKTRLGTILHYAKQGQNRMLMNMLIAEIKPKIKEIIHDFKIDAIAYVSPTIKRETQLMKVLATGLKITLPQIEIRKISGIIPVPQKSLNKIEDRISNAENTFAVRSLAKFKNLLLIDDAVGSGSTLNQIAGKIKDRKIAKKIIGLAIVGSFEDFDVITDV